MQTILILELQYVGQLAEVDNDINYRSQANQERFLLLNISIILCFQALLREAMAVMRIALFLLLTTAQLQFLIEPIFALHYLLNLKIKFVLPAVYSALMFLESE